MAAIRVYGSSDPSHPWVNGRRIWNQPSYHVTNVNDDGSIPQYEAPSWLINNTYRTQAAIGQNPNPYLTPNLTASYFRQQHESAGLNVTVRVGNGGATEAAAGAGVSFYNGTSSNGTLLNTVYTTKTLQPGEYEDVSFTLGSGYAGITAITAVVDDAGLVPECREDDNTVTLGALISGMPDLTIGAEDISLSPGPYYEGGFVSITASVRNAGYYPAANTQVRLYDGNPESNGMQIGTQTISSIDAGGSAAITFTFDTLGKSGTHVLYAVVDPENAIAETNEENNSAGVTLDVEQPVLPNLTITRTTSLYRRHRSGKGSSLR